MHTFEQGKRDLSLVDELLIVFLVDVLGISQHLYRTELVENLVETYGDSLTLGHVKSQFELTAEQELKIMMILHPALKVPASEDWTRIMPLAEETAAASEGKTLILQLAA